MRTGRFKLNNAVLMCTIIIFLLTGCGTDKDVKNVIDEIDSIGDVALESEEKIITVESEYEALTEEQKGKVSNVDTLKKARIDLDNLKEKKLEKDCLVDIAVGLELSWDLNEAPFSSNEEFIKNYKDAIDEELEYSRKHEQDSFQNQDFKDILTKYISALEHMEKGIEGYGTDAALYNSEYIESGYIVRADCLSKWKTSYGLSVDSKYEEKLKSSIDENAAMKMTEFGETVQVSCEYGDAQITFEDVEISKEWTNYAEDELTDDQEIILLKLIVKNISYEDEWNPGMMGLENYLWVQDMSGITITPMSSAWEYAGYENAAGAFFEIRKNETKKVVVPYVINKECKGIFIKATNDFLFFAF